MKRLSLTILPILLWLLAALAWPYPGGAELAPPLDSILMEAVKKNDADYLTFILSSQKGGFKDEINRRGNFGDTPLILAAGNGNLAIVTLLVEHGAAIDGPAGKDDRTALIAAAGRGHAQVVEYLLAKGADINGRHKGVTALLAACDIISVATRPEGDRKKTIQILLDKGAEVNVQDESWLKTGTTPLMFTVLTGDPQLVRAMLGKGANPNIQNSRGETALDLANKKDLGPIARLLKKAGGQEGPAGRSVAGLSESLVVAVSEGKVVRVQALLAKGADVNARLAGGLTPLMVAAGKNRAATAVFLLAKGADLNIQDETGKTALFHAAGKGHLASVKVLVAKGAKLNLQTKNEETALAEAISEKHYDVALFLIKSGADTSSPDLLFRAVASGSERLTKIFVEKGAGVNGRGLSGKTPVMVAAQGESSVLRYLIAKGADVNLKDNDGRTALMAALEYYGSAKLDCARYLWEHRADLNAADNKGETALIQAIKRYDAESVRFLLDKGCSVTLVDASGKTAWSYAFEQSNAQLMAQLEQKGAKAVYIGVEWSGNVSQQKEAFIKVVDTEQEWTTLWQRAFGKPAPRLDFDHYGVACIFLGHKAAWLFSISIGPPEVRDEVVVIPYGLSENVIELRLSGPFKAGGQYRMKVLEKVAGKNMFLENTLAMRRR
jgi:ankyrin repeat protein